jgi:hypothetical protein
LTLALSESSPPAQNESVNSEATRKRSVPAPPSTASGITFATSCCTFVTFELNVTVYEPRTPAA